MGLNYGMSRPIGIEGASTADRALSRAGAARDPISEYVTAGFVGFFLAAPAVVVWFLVALVDWEGLGELFYRVCNFG